ncbi:MAG: HAD-IB family hydrolase [Tissierellia bacterium]|nr:HAD-IB family hydrolase [Tissierellia bacterium]
MKKKAKNQPINKENRKNKAAFFDIDGTLFRSSLLVEQFKILIKREIIDPKVWFDEIKPLYDQYDKRYGEYDNYLLTLTTQYQKKLKGISLEYINKLSKEIVQRNKDIVYRVTRKALNRHRKDGYKIFFISGSPDFLVNEFAKYYKADYCIGTKYIFDKDNKFTGDIRPMWDSKNKIKALNFLCEKFDIDLNNSYAYGDTNGDLSILKAVSNPIAVNPSFEFLTKIIEDIDLSKKTKVYIERKDVLYEYNLENKNVEFKKF